MTDGVPRDTGRPCRKMEPRVLRHGLSAACLGLLTRLRRKHAALVAKGDGELPHFEFLVGSEETGISRSLHLPPLTDALQRSYPPPFLEACYF